jgi:hypothetical protein
VGLFDPEYLPGFGLRNATLFDEAVDLKSESGL